MIEDILMMENGREILEWLVWRSLVEKQIPIVGLKKVMYDKTEKENLCTIDDLINKGIVHLIDGSIEIRNNYYLMALRESLGIDRAILVDLLNLSGLMRDDALRLLSWQFKCNGCIF